MTVLDKIGQELVKEIQRQVLLLDLFDTGEFLRSIKYRIEGTKLIIYSDSPYSEDLEYGTFDMKQDEGDQVLNNPWKKKNLDPQSARNLPRGMFPYAPFRRVVYNKQILEAAIRRAIVS